MSSLNDLLLPGYPQIVSPFFSIGGRIHVPIRDQKNAQVCKSDSQHQSPSQANKLVSQLRRDNRKSKTASLAIAQSPQNLNTKRNQTVPALLLALRQVWAATWQARLPEFSFGKVEPYPKSLGGHHHSTPHLPNNPSPFVFFISISPAVELSKQLNLPLSL